MGWGDGGGERPVPAAHRRQGPGCGAVGRAAQVTAAAEAETSPNAPLIARATVAVATAVAIEVVVAIEATTNGMTMVGGGGSE